MVCPICNKRKEQLCPARAESICSICCGTEREVAIDSPATACTLFPAAKTIWRGWRLTGPSRPLPGSNSIAVLPPRTARCCSILDHAICQFAADHRALVDADVLAALRTLAETYRTQASGIIYEKPLDYLLQRELYDHLKASFAEFRKKTRNAPA